MSRKLSPILVVLFFISLSEEGDAQLSIFVQPGYSKPYGLEKTQKATAYDMTAVLTSCFGIQYSFQLPKGMASISLIRSSFGNKIFAVDPFTDNINLLGPGLPTDVAKTSIYHYNGIGLGYGIKLNQRNVLQFDINYLRIRRVDRTITYSYPNPDPRPERSYSETYRYSLDDSYRQFNLFHNQWNICLSYKHNILPKLAICLSSSSGLNRFEELGGLDTPFGRTLILHQFVGIGLEYRVPKIPVKRCLQKRNK